VGATWTVVNLPDGGVRVELRGEVDLVAEAPLVEQIDELAGHDDTGEILLDLSAVEFIDSSGVRALVRVQQEHGARVRLAAVSHPVRRVLDIAGLTVGFGLDDAEVGVAGDGGDAGEVPSATDAATGKPTHDAL
jgi:anti-sigma B factor antagonist